MRYGLQFLKKGKQMSCEIWKMPEFTSTVKIVIEGNSHTCWNIDDYIDLVIEDYKDKYNIELHPDEIEDIVQWGGDEQ
jgi:hypothetical protein